MCAIIIISHSLECLLLGFRVGFLTVHVPRSNKVQIMARTYRKLLYHSVFLTVLLQDEICREELNSNIIAESPQLNTNRSPGANTLVLPSSYLSLSSLDSS